MSNFFRTLINKKKSPGLIFVLMPSFRATKWVHVSSETTERINRKWKSILKFLFQRSEAWMWALYLSKSTLWWSSRALLKYLCWLFREAACAAHVPCLCHSYFLKEHRPNEWGRHLRSSSSIQHQRTKHVSSVQIYHLKWIPEFSRCWTK